MNLIIKVLNKDSIDDEELRKMVNDGSFQKIYSYYFAIEMKDLYNTDGIWVKYDKGGDYRKLAESLNGYQTHWCTEGLGTAEAQLACGDFYIYYTIDKQGNYKVPRLAIRMEDNNIAEIRGISENQNIEPEMKDVIEVKLKEFPDRDKYYKKAKHMDILTELYKKFNNNVDFSMEELRFLYEIDEYIVGFGHQHDPRINEILSKRDIYKDLSKIFNYDVKEGQDNYIRSLRNGNAIKPNDPSFPKVLVGNIPFMENIDGIVFPDVLIGDINLGGVESIKNTKFPKRANSGSGSNKNGDLNIGTGSNNAVLENVIFPYEISGNLKVTARIAKDVVLPQIVHGNVDIKLDTYTNVVLPEEVIGTFELNIKYAKDITLPKRITKSIIIYSLGPTIENLRFPEICWSIALPEIIYGDGLVLPRMLQHDLILDKITHAKDMILPEVVGGDVNLCNLIDGTNLVLPKTIAKSLDLRNLVYCDGMVLPKKINGDLKISNVAVNYFGLDTLESIVDGKINIYGENKVFSNKDKSI
jgi:hypothetical protein